METIIGFNIIKRDLTEEEACREITFDRFEKFHHTVGEDFLDTVGSIIKEDIFYGWCLHRYPESSKDILHIANKGFIQDLIDLHGPDNFYTDFAAFLNQTEAAKARVNQILIQVEEHYNN